LESVALGDGPLFRRQTRESLARLSSSSTPALGWRLTDHGRKTISRAEDGIISPVKIDDLSAGMSVVWINTPRSGFTIPVDAVVLSVGPKCARIRVLLKDGRQIERVLAPST
jgi:hypothetical protein